MEYVYKLAFFAFNNFSTFLKYEEVSNGILDRILSEIIKIMIN